MIHKKKQGETKAKDIANDVIDFVESTVRPKLASDDSAVYLLFDPMPVNDLNVSGQLRTFTTTRRSIKSSYKANREANPLVIEAADYLFKYFSYRDPVYRLMISERHEADDFVESIVKGSGKTLLISSDFDWARYLSDDVEMSLGDVNKPFTTSDFIQKFGYYPSIKNVTVNKALFGDESDNIAGLFSPKLKFNFKPLGEAAMAFIAKQDESLDAFLSRAKKYTFKGLFALESRNPEEEFFYQLECFEKENLVSQFFASVQVIRSLCPDASKFVRRYEKRDEGFCSLIDKSLGRDGKKPKFRFGGVRV